MGLRESWLLRRPEILEHAEMSLRAEHTLQLTGHLDAATHDDNVDVVGWTFEEDVTHVTAHDVTFDTESVGGFAYLVEYLLV